MPFLWTEGVHKMTGNFSIIATIKKGDYDILKALEDNCFIITDLKLISHNQILINIEAFGIFD